MVCRRVSPVILLLFFFFMCVGVCACVLSFCVCLFSFIHGFPRIFLWFSCVYIATFSHAWRILRISLVLVFVCFPQYVLVFNEFDSESNALLECRSSASLCRC